MANLHGQSPGDTRQGSATSYDGVPDDQCVHSQDAGGWVRALAVATFDVGTGHTLEQVYPADSLDEGDRQRIRMLAMPDCNTTQIGDCFYCFRTRKSHRTPLLSSSLLEQTFEYCYAFFRQEKNKECARGMFQKSVVLVSRYPYVNLFERLVKVIGPLYFAHGPAVLEAVFTSLLEWPAPCPGALCPLPFLSETIMFQVPDIDMPPQVASTYRYHRGTHLCSLWPRERVSRLTRTMSGCGSWDLSQAESPARRRISTSSSRINEADERTHGGNDDSTVGRSGGGTRTRFSVGSVTSVHTADAMNSLEELEASTARLAASLTIHAGGNSFAGQTASEQNAKRGVAAAAGGSGSTTAASSNSTPLGLRVHMGSSPFTTPDPAAAESGIDLTRLRVDSTPNMDRTQSSTTGSATHTLKKAVPPLTLDYFGRDVSPRQRTCSIADAAISPRSAGFGTGAGPVLWSGAARSPGVLLSPGLQEGAGGIDGVAASRRRSSLGSGSLASVVTNSDSECWLATPKAAGSPLMVLDSNSGSNLAQSCYYVADRDSEEDEEEVDTREGESTQLALETAAAAAAAELGWQVAEGADKGKQIDLSPRDEAGVEKDIQVDCCNGVASAGVVHGDGRVAATAAGGGKESDGGASGEIKTQAESDARSAGNTPAPSAGATAKESTTPPAVASTSGEQHHGTSVPSGPKPDEKDLAAPTSGATITAATGRERERAASLSPPRSSPVAALSSSSISQHHPQPRSITPLGGAEPLSRFSRSSTTGAVPRDCPKKTSSSTKPWSGLRAWADSAPEDPWHAPPALFSPFLPRSKSANNSPAIQSAAAAQHAWSPAGASRNKSGGGERLLSDDDESGKACADELADESVDDRERGKESNGVTSTVAIGRQQSEPPPAASTVASTDEGGGVWELFGAGAERKNGGNVGVADRRVDKSGGAAVRASSAGRAKGDDAFRDRETLTAAAGPKAAAGAEAIPTEVPEEQRKTMAGGDARSAARGVDSVNTTPVMVVPVAVDTGTRVMASNDRTPMSDKAPAGEKTPSRDEVPTGDEAHLDDREDGEKEGDGDAGAGANGVELGESPPCSGKGVEEKRRSVMGGAGGQVQPGNDGRPLSRKIGRDRASIHIHRSARSLQGGRSPFAEMLLADEARFRAKQGLFQSIGLYSIFGKKLVEHLWLLWELVLTGSPTLVVGPSVGASSAAILGMVSLASPVYFGGDFRPHFTAFDPDYREIVAAHDKVSKQQLWGSSVLGVQSGASGGDANGGFPSMLLGVINPIFLRTLSRWPNAIVLPGAAGRSVSNNAHGGVPDGSSGSISNGLLRVPSTPNSSFLKLQRDLTVGSASSSPRNLRCPAPKVDGVPASRPRPPPVRVQVIRAGASLDQVVGQDDKPDEPIIISRQSPVMVPDVAVLSRLLDPSCPYNPAMTAQAAAAAAAGSNFSEGTPPTPTSAGVAVMAAKAAAAAKGGNETKGQWKDSLRAINDVILRRHFADLTRSFLAPFDRYFRRAKPPQHLTPWKQRALARLSVYTEPELLVARFSEEEFLTEMFVAGPPKEFAHVQWETLYRRFMNSPNFKPWFTTQKMEGVERLREFNRAVCLRTDPPTLVESCAPARLPQLLAKIKASIARQWKNRAKNVDWELLERMEMHQAAVEAAVSAAKNTSGAAMP